MNRVTPALLDNFWLRMAGMFGHTWVSQYGASPTGLGGDTWSAALADLSRAQIKQGLSSALASGADWPPSAPRFRAMCLAIPTLAAVQLALNGKAEPTPFSRLVHQNLDTYRMRQADADKADRMVRDAYELAREHVMQGGELPSEPVALIEQHKPEHVPAPKEVAEAHLAAMAAILKAKEPAENDDETPPSGEAA